VKSVMKKLLSCLFLLDVLCVFRKTEKFGIMNRCSKCLHYKRFLREMEEEEEQFWEEEEKIRKFGYPRKFDVSKGGS
jgi:hypothetical protein